MLADFEGWRIQPSSPVAEALAAVRAVEALTTDEPMVLGVAPVARANPYQSLLYREFYRRGIAVTPVTDPRAFPQLTDVGALRTAVHLHWLSFVLAGAADPAAARRAVRGFTETLDDFRSAGGQVVWTVHNVLPHDAAFPDEEISLRNAVAEASTVVHVMSDATLDAVAHTATIDPARVVVAPHPSYLGAYPDSVTREEARLALAIEPDELVYVLFGAIKPYKGLDRLLEAFDAARGRADRPMRLLVAGQPDGTPAAQRFVARCAVHPFVSIRASKVPAEHVQYFLRAADIGLAPYERILNSGAAMLYTTFGLPSVVPDEAPIRSSLPEGAHVAFHDTTALPSALLQARELVGEASAAVIRAHAERLAPSVVSDSFAGELRMRLLAGPRPRTTSL